MMSAMTKIDPSEQPPYCGVCGRKLQDIGMPMGLTLCVGSVPLDVGCLTLVRGPGPLFFEQQSELDPNLPAEIVKGAEQIRARIKAAVAARH